MTDLPEYIEGLPNLSGSEETIARAMKEGRQRAPFYAPRGFIDFGSIRSAFGVALHMHQPLIPAGGGDLRTAEVISNLKHMFDNPGVGDNHNASVFQWCYKRMGEFIPELIAEGKNPRVMLEYSGTLLHGLRQMGADDVIDALKHITLDPDISARVEWLGAPWGHAVAPSTPVTDFRLHVRAFQQHFAAIFGLEALERVRGFSPSEMALPNHPDVAYEYIKTLKEAGYDWLLVQEHTVELPEKGSTPQRKHIPYRLVCRNSKGDEVSMIALVKTQGSDTKLVAQMQPYHEAKGLDRVELAGKQIPPFVIQIADGENGGVMMNEFPDGYKIGIREASGSPTPAMNGTEYLEHLAGMGITEKDFPVIQPLLQKRIWDEMQPGDGPEKLAQTIAKLKQADDRFHMEGGSWTNDLSWVRGYENVLGPMEKVSALFNETIAKSGVKTSDPRYRKALFYLLTSQTSCYRYWGQGTWTDYGIELTRRVEEVLKNDF